MVGYSCLILGWRQEQDWQGQSPAPCKAFHPTNSLVTSSNSGGRGYLTPPTATSSRLFQVKGRIQPVQVTSPFRETRIGQVNGPGNAESGGSVGPGRLTVRGDASYNRNSRAPNFGMISSFIIKSRAGSATFNFCPTRDHPNRATQAIRSCPGRVLPPRIAGRPPPGARCHAMIRAAAGTRTVTPGPDHLIFGPTVRQRHSTVGRPTMVLRLAAQTNRNTRSNLKNGTEPLTPASDSELYPIRRNDDGRVSHLRQTVPRPEP
eukprot:753472-Hanusia_phi.AAC.5